MTTLGMLASWALALPAVLCLGLPVGRACGARGPSFVRVSLWSGLLIAACVVVALNLVTPLRSTTSVVALLVLAALCLVLGLGSRSARVRFRRGWRPLGPVA